MHLSTPPHGQYVIQGQFLKRSFTGLISEFSFSYIGCLRKVKEPKQLYYLPKAGG